MTLFYHQDVTVKDQNKISNIEEIVEYKSTKTTLPFLKDNEFDYSYLNQMVPVKNKKVSP